jgi:hypothetical protein
MKPTDQRPTPFDLAQKFLESAAAMQQAWDACDRANREYDEAYRDMETFMASSGHRNILARRDGQIKSEYIQLFSAAAVDRNGETTTYHQLKITRFEPVEMLAWPAETERPAVAEAVPDMMGTVRHWSENANSMPPAVAEAVTDLSAESDGHCDCSPRRARERAVIGFFKALPVDELEI